MHCTDGRAIAQLLLRSSGRIAQNCFASLDAPVQTIGALDLPAVPMNMGLEAAMLPNADKVAEKIRCLLNY